MLSKAEQEYRKKIIDYGIASCELEGCIISDEYKALSKQYIDGKITLAELAAKMRETFNIQ